MVLRLLVGIRFQVLFHSPPGVLFTFPSRYYALSVAKKYFALEGGPPCFPQGSSCPVVLWIPAVCFVFCLQGSYLLWPAFPGCSATFCILLPVLNPDWDVRCGMLEVGSLGEFALANSFEFSLPTSHFSPPNRFGLFPVRSPLLRESRLITFPRGT